MRRSVSSTSSTPGEGGPENSYTTKSVGGFANVRLAELMAGGVGANWTAQTDSYLAPSSSVNDYRSHLLGFVALQYLLAGQLYIKAESAFAKAFFQPSDVDSLVEQQHVQRRRPIDVPVLML